MYLFQKSELFCGDKRDGGREEIKTLPTSGVVQFSLNKKLRREDQKIALQTKMKELINAGIQMINTVLKNMVCRSSKISFEDCGFRQLNLYQSQSQYIFPRKEEYVTCSGGGSSADPNTYA